MSTLEELSSEDLGFKLSTKSEGIPIFKNTIDFSEGDKNDLRLLTIGNLSGRFACSNLSEIVLDNLSVLEDTEEFSSDSLKRIEGLTNVSQLHFNCDETKLYVLVDSTLKVIDVSEFMTTSQLDSSIIRDISCSNAEYLQNVKIVEQSPRDPSSIALLNKSNDLILINNKETRKLSSDVSGFCWSIKGENVYYGHISSTDINCVSSDDLANKFKIPTSEIAEVNDFNIINITELESNSKWFVVFDKGDGEPDDHEYQSYIVNKTNGDNYQFYETDIAPPFGSVSRFGTYYLSSLVNWYPGQKLIFVTSSLATEISTLFINQEKNIESITQLNDSDRAQFPINDDTGDDASPIGLGLDLSCTEITIQEPCSGIDETKGTLPRLWCLNHEGGLTGWWVFDVHGLRNNKVSLNGPVEFLKQLTTVTSDREDSNEGKNDSTNSGTEFFNPKQVSDKESPGGDKINDTTTNSTFKSTEQGKTTSSAGFETSKFGSAGFTSNDTRINKSAFGNLGVGNKEDQTDQKANSSGFGSTGFGFGSSTSNSSGFGATSFGTPAFGSSNFGANSGGVKNENTFGKTGFGSNTISSNSSTARPLTNQTSGSSFGKYSNNLGSESQSSPFSSIQAKESPFAKLGKAQAETKSSNQSPFANLAKEDSPFAKLGTAQAETETKNQSPFATLAKEDSPFAKLGSAQAETETKNQSPFASLAKEDSPFAKFGNGKDQSVTKSNNQSPFASLAREDSPFAKFGKDQDQSETKSNNQLPFASLAREDSPFAKFGKDQAESTFSNQSPFVSLTGKESPFGKDQGEAKSSNQSPFARLKDQEATLGSSKKESSVVPESSDSSNQSGMSNDETSSETPAEGEENDANRESSSTNGNETESKIELSSMSEVLNRQLLAESTEPTDAHVDEVNDTESSNSDSSESSDETDNENHIELNTKVNNEKETLSGALDRNQLNSNLEKVDNFASDRHGISSDVTHKQEKPRLSKESSTQTLEGDSGSQVKPRGPPALVQFLKYDGFTKASENESNMIAQKVVDIYNETSGYLTVMEKNINSLGDFIRDHDTTVGSDMSLESPELWRLSSSSEMKNKIEKIKPPVLDVLKSSYELDSLSVDLMKKVEESQVQRVKIDKLLTQLSLFTTESAFLKLSKRPLDFQNESLQVGLRQKLKKIKDLESKLISKMMPLKARSSVDKVILKNLEKVIFQINENAFNRLKEIDILTSELGNFHVNDEGTRALVPVEDNSQKTLPIKWALSNDLKIKNVSPRLVTLKRK